jgi:phosphoglycerate dehydrogenase-like enzyme
MKKILFTCSIEDAEARERMAQVVEVKECPEADSPEKIIAAAGECEGIIVPYSNERLITEGVLAALPGLKLVGTTYGGVRQNIDDVAALQRGLLVIHTGPTRIRPMAEYTLGMILCALTRLYNYHHAMCSGSAWPRFDFGRTRVLHQRRVGVIGYGLIGRGIAELLRHFTDKISILSSHAGDRKLSEQGFEKAASLEEVFSGSEVIVLAGGYTPQTHHLIGREHFDRMADEALFVNIARGAMVDEAAMLDVVQRRNIFLALDVFETEPLAADSPLRKSERVLLAPHRANAPREFEERWKFLALELERYAKGQRPESALTMERAAAMSAS